VFSERKSPTFTRKYNENR